MIEFDGDYWHSLPKNIINDRIKDIVYSNRGFKILRIQEGKYYQNKDDIINQTIKYIEKEFNYENNTNN